MLAHSTAHMAACLPQRSRSTTWTSSSGGTTARSSPTGHIKPELDNTLGVINRDMTIDTLAGALAGNADEVARFDKGIIQSANVAILG